MPMRYILAVLSCTLLLGMQSCDKEDNNGTTDLRIRLTDSPFDATEVNVDIREVNVNFHDDDPEGWTSLATHQGIYNLLELQNGIDTLIAQGTVPAGVLKEVRFVLGSENSITIDNVNYPLTIPSRIVCAPLCPALGSDQHEKKGLGETHDASLAGRDGIA